MNALPSVSRPFSDRAETVALCLIVVCAFVVPLPTALISICTFLFLLAWLAAGKLGERWATLRRHPTSSVQTRTAPRRREAATPTGIRAECVREAGSRALIQRNPRACLSSATRDRSPE